MKRLTREHMALWIESIHKRHVLTQRKGIAPVTGKMVGRLGLVLFFYVIVFTNDYYLAKGLLP